MDGFGDHQIWLHGTRSVRIINGVHISPNVVDIINKYCGPAPQKNKINISSSKSISARETSQPRFNIKHAMRSFQYINCILTE